MRPSTPLALLSFAVAPEEAPPGDSVVFEPVDGTSDPDRARAFGRRRDRGNGRPRRR